jgi:hypothetical protein
MKRTMFQETKTKRTWTCRYCRKSFRNKAELKSHYEDNLWESCIQKTGKIYVCQICKNKFDSTKTFREHWDSDHDDEAIGLNFMKSVGRKSGKGDWSMRPVERVLIIDRLRTDKTKRALKQDYVANSLMTEELEYGVARRAMSVIEILGIPEVGKSVFGLTIARHLQTLWKQELDDLWRENPEKFAAITGSRDENGKPLYYMPMIRIGFNMQQTSEHIRAARMGDVVIQDEDPALAGYEARSIQNQIENLLKIMRKACVSMVFISPVQVSYISVPTMVLEVIAKDIERRLTVAALYDRQHNAHGWVVLEILKADDPLMQFYEQEKDKNIASIKEAGGRESAVINQEMLRRDSERLYKFLLSVGFNPAQERASIDFLKGVALLAGIKGSTNYIELVARNLQKALATSEFVITKDGYIAPLQPDKVITSDNEFVIVLEDVIEGSEILNLIYESSEEAYNAKLARGEKKPQKLHVEYIKTDEGQIKFFSKHAEAWMLVYVKGYTMQATADALVRYSESGVSLTDSAIANSYKNDGWRAIYQEELSGEAAEIAIKKYLFPEDEWRLIGGFGQPDIINTVDNTWIEVKARNRLRPKEQIESQITDFEYEHVREGHRVKVIRIGYAPERARIEIWNVSLNPEWLAQGIDEELSDDEDEETIDGEE